MNNLVQRLKAAWHFWRFYPATSLPDDFWTDSDARALSNYLVSDSGIKFRRILLEKVNQSSIRAIMEQAHSEYMAGTAFGIRGTIAQIDALLQISLPTNELSELTERQLEGEFRSVNR